MEAEKKPSRSSLPRTALPRIYFIDDEIASRKYPNTKDLAEKYETSISTISRDIAFMRIMLHAPIEYDPFHRGYYYSEKTFRLPAGFTGADDLLALGMAKNILSLYRETPLYEASVHLMESILAPIAADGNRDWLENRIAVPKIASAEVKPDIWEIIVAGLKENRIITFEYLGANDKEYQTRKVHPYQLLFDSGVWYLYGYAEERKGIRIFSLSRIKNAVLCRDHFSLPGNFSYSDSTGGSYFGVFVGQEKFHFSIDCHGDAVIYATERKWAEDQKNKKIEDGITMEFTSTQFDKVLLWVLSNGCYAIPRKPETLVEKWKWHIRKMGKLTR